MGNAILDGLQADIHDAIDKFSGVGANHVVTALGGAAAGALVGGAVATAVARRKKSRRSSHPKKRVKARRKSHHRRSKRSGRKSSRKKKSRSTRKIHMTKNGQPYVLMASGKARFIKKRGASSSRKRKGGRY